MPVRRPLGVSIRGQGGSTLIELLVAMPCAVIAVLIALGALQDAGTGQARTQKREDALRVVQSGVERMTREIRQADWVFFRSSSEVDLGARVRRPGTASAVPRLVRYSCAGTACRRLEGPPVAFPPPATAAVADTGVVLSGLRGTLVFQPQRIDPATGRSVADFTTPDSVFVRVLADIEGFDHPLELKDAASLRNATRFGT